MKISAPSDNTLTEHGLAPTGRGRVLLIACGALAREILAVIRANGFEHIDLQCLPAILHNHPERIVPAVKAAVHEARSDDPNRPIFVVYADCGTGGQMETAAEELGVTMMPGPHCYAFFEGTEGFLERAGEEFTALYLTDFLVRQFDAFLWRPLGLDKNPELRDMYFAHYEKLVYQAQTEDPNLVALAKDCAERLKLPFEYRFTGYGDLAQEIEKVANSS